MADPKPLGAGAVDAHHDFGYNRSACTECQRRKQKCNREWPCDRCQRRKIADECRYNYADPTLDVPAHDLTEKLKRSHDDYASRGLSVEGDADADADGDGDASGFDTLANRLYATLGIDHGVAELPAPRQDFVKADSSPQMRRVLKLLPQRQSMDLLMQNFLNDINYHYYIIYPPVFLQDYHIWWDRRSQERPLSLQYTCLLAIICACALQHVDAETPSQQILERELGEGLDVASDRLHGAMRELASVIPVGHYHFLNVQRLLHSCYWYKAEAKFLEAWHVLSAAILEAQELGYHREPAPGSASDFDLEMRRRLWCILDTWDWQISSGLSRPKIIDRADCDAELPKLTLEGHKVSPLLHMKMQSGLTRQLASRFSAPKNIIAPSEVQEYKALIEQWVDQFPPEYSFEKPDTSKDEKCPWLFAHRFYVYTMACLLILNPIRHYMVKQYRWESPEDELTIREAGIWYSLKLMKTLRLWVDKICRRDGRMHFIIFSIFDTAAILCTAIVKDGEHTIVNRPDVLTAIGDAVDMLRKLSQISKTSKTSYDILERLVRRLPDYVPRAYPERQVKRTKFQTQSPSYSLAATVHPASQLAASQEGVDHQRHIHRPRAGPPAIAPLPQAPSVSAVPLHMSVVAASPPTSLNMTPQQYGYGSSEFAHQSMPGDGGGSQDVAQVTQVTHQDLQPSRGLRQGMPPQHGSPFVAVHTHHAASVGSVSHGYGNEHTGWSAAGGSETTPTSQDERSIISSTSFPAANEPTMRIEGAALPPQQIADGSPDFNIENLTDAQLGELAPLWNWHSENLDLANLPPVIPNANAFPRAT